MCRHTSNKTSFIGTHYFSPAQGETERKRKKQVDK